MKRHNMYRVAAVQLPVYFVLCGTIIARMWSQQFNFLPSAVKFIFVAMLWASVILFPYKLMNNGIEKHAKLCINILLIIGVLQVLRSIIFDVDWEIGNKYITIMLNEHMTPLFFPPLFCFLANSSTAIRYIVRGNSILIISFLFLLLFGRNCFAYVPVFLTPFYVLSSSRGKALILLTFIFALIAALNGIRFAFIFVAIGLLALLLVYLKNAKKGIVALCVFLVVVPSFWFIPLLNTNNTDDSIFDTIIVKINSFHLSSADAGVDTRTFLYAEMSEDLTKNGSWIFGKGIYSHYYSYFFEMSKSGEGDYHYRLESEVPFLNFLLHGGIIYAIFYYSLFIMAIFRALRFGKSRFMLLTAALLSTYLFTTFIGDLNGCCWYHLVVFFLIGCCLSNKWLRLDDTQIKELLVWN